MRGLWRQSVRKKFRQKYEVRFIHAQQISLYNFMVLRKNNRHSWRLNKSSKGFPRNTVRGIFKKVCILRNFAFYNFSEILVFQPLEKDVTTLQLLRILHGIIIISKFVRRTTARAIFRNFSIFRNFAFYNFSENLGILVFNPYKRTGQQFMIPWHHYYDKASQNSESSWFSVLQRGLGNFTVIFNIT